MATQAPTMNHESANPTHLGQVEDHGGMNHGGMAHDMSDPEGKAELRKLEQSNRAWLTI